MRTAIALLLTSLLAGCSRGDPPPVPAYRVAHDAVTTGPWTNRLVLATSPYLAMHAHNPVDWHPWGADAFAEAKRRDVPVFLSMGYLACHWCHVMDAESFSNPAIAAHLNAWFVPIAVDREERPDVDGLYQAALQRLTGDGGWPASLWLTPDGRPIAGGTYYPPQARFGRPGFGDVLQRVHTQWTTDRHDALATARVTAEQLQRRAVLPVGSSFPSTAPDKAVAQLGDAWDAAHAGWGDTMKFPNVPRLALLLDHGVAHGDDTALARVRAALDAMDRGGIHDQLGGGFHRYTVDPTWTVPHFEKMATDNAQLLRLYAEAAVALDDPRYAAVAADTAGFLLGPLAAPDGTFYSSLAATDPKGEGAYYTWTPAEVRTVLGANAPGFLAAYGVTDAGNFHDGRSVLVRGAGVDPADPALAADRARLLAARAARPAPPADTKRVIAYNALAIGALARAGRLLHHPEWVAAAGKAMHVVLAARGDSLVLPRTLEADSPPGIVDDQAFTVQALLDLYEADADPSWLLQADALTASMLDRFGDSRDGGLWVTDRTAPGLLVRRKVPEDNALPSGEAVAVLDLWRLRAYGAPHGDPAILDKALKSASVLLVRAPGAVPTLSRVVDALSRASVEAVVATAPGHAADAAPFLAAFDARYRPYAVLARIDPASEARLAGFRALEGKSAAAAPVLGYVCFDGACKQPTADPRAFRKSVDAAPKVETAGQGALP